MKIAYILLSIIAFASCNQSPQPLTPQQREAIIKEVKQMLDAYEHDIETKGLLAEFKHLDSTADFFWVPPGSTAAMSYSDVVTAIKANAGRSTTIDNHWETLKIVPLSASLASYTGKLVSVMTDTTGKVNNDTLIETGNIIKRDDGWKLLNGQTAILNKKII